MNKPFLVIIASLFLLSGCQTVEKVEPKESNETKQKKVKKLLKENMLKRKL